MASSRVDATPVLDQAAFLQLVRWQVPVSHWPATDLRLTTVDWQTGETVLWSREDGIDLATAIATSCAVPGYLPAVSFNGAHYTDGPRVPSAAALAKEKNLDAFVFIGARTGVLANAAEDAELDDLARQRLPIVKTTDGPAFAEVSGELLDQGLRPRAAQISLDDGRRAALKVAELLWCRAPPRSGELAPLPTVLVLASARSAEQDQGCQRRALRDLSLPIPVREQHQP
ncbi:hypothetical protein ACFV0C_38130 [Streptomyces sp. NPDC059568]|uniref:hypothetical protein n=1 Tax=Streptomyces sp. NPDC059568 TaxID=3346868 RepID=UPI0036D0F201